jgi:anhydro-N-acetylmuramic acid kinase
MIVAGIMSGTSADGVDVALVHFALGERASTPRFKLLGHAHFPYRAAVRQAVLRAMNAMEASVADLSRLNFLLGEVYAEALVATQRRFRRRADLVGCHGQTIYHQGEPERFLSRRTACTWQTGEAAVIAARVGVPVVSDFRTADMAAGGKGAPLVPFLDYLLYRDARLGRIVQNIGGIANLTAIPAGAKPGRLLAFDTGPGNMLIDAVAQELFDRPYDRDGRAAASGTAHDGIVRRFLARPYFRQVPPKTAGREQFGREFARLFLRACERLSKPDIIATATALTARSIADAINRFVLRPRTDYRELIISGGGAHNPVLMAMLANEVKPLGLTVRLSDEFGLPSETKEAVAFALLAYETWNRRPSNIPSATGARRPAILGKISYA